MGAEEILFFLYVSVVLSHAFEYHACRKRVFLLCLVTLPFKFFFFFFSGGVYSEGRNKLSIPEASAVKKPIVSLIPLKGGRYCL